MRKFRWIDLALLPFGLCEGAVLALSGLAPLGTTVYRLTEEVSTGRLLLTFLMVCYGMMYVYMFIKMLRHYHLPFDDAFDLCVRDLEWLAAKWHTTYHIVNLLVFILFYLILLGLNIYLAYSLCCY